MAGWKISGVVMNAEQIRATYRRWWVGKKCRPRNSLGQFKLVKDLIIYGSGSLMVCVVKLIYEDDTQELTGMGVDAYRPRKSDVEVEETD